MFSSQRNNSMHVFKATASNNTYVIQQLVFVLILVSQT